MKDLNNLKTRYFHIPSKKVANHIEEWLATINFKKYGIDDWSEKSTRIFFTTDKMYLFTDTYSDESWEKLYDYGMPEYNPQVKGTTEKLTKDNIRNFYFEVNSQDEVNNALKILESAGETIISTNFSFVCDIWCYVCYFNGLGWRLDNNDLGKKSTYDELTKLYENNKTTDVKLYPNITISGNLPKDRITYVNELVDTCSDSFEVGSSFLDLINGKVSKIICHEYSYYVEYDRLYVRISNINGNKSQCIYDKGIWANKTDYLIEEAKKRYPIGTKFKPAHVHDDAYCIISTNNFEINELADTIYATLENSSICELEPFNYGNTNYSRIVYYKGKWAEIIKEGVIKDDIIKPNSATSPKNIKALCYPDVVHVKTKEEHAKLKSVHSNMTNWKDTHHYYLIGAEGFAEKRQAYENYIYTIYEMEQIIIDESIFLPSANLEKAKRLYPVGTEIFPGIKIGDIVVSLAKKPDYRDVGDMFKVLDNSTIGTLYYLQETNSSEPESFRLATTEEIELYNKGIKKINVEKISTETNLQKAKRLYPKGTRFYPLSSKGDVKNCIEIIGNSEFHEHPIFNNSISSTDIIGFVYSAAADKWAEIIEKEKPNRVKKSIEVGDYVTVISSVSSANDAAKLIGKTFKVTKKAFTDGFKSTFYVCGAKQQYPHLFHLAEGGIYEEDIRLATSDEINTLEYIPTNTDVKSMYGEILTISKNDIDLKFKSSKETINTTVPSIPTINKELKQKKQKFYF